jgi:diphosphoinositol-polyphosphate diphosphatase
VVTTPLRLERRQSEQINLKVTSQKISRNGRQTQRWFTDPTTQKVYRMVTGCVPIVEGGRILFVSSSRKPEWILPKGGWEKDEAMEESAIRECFEEAGVLGILGPRLSEIEYETRKAKKRRLDFEEIQKKAKMFRKTSSSPKREAECESPSEGQNKTGNVPETLETPAALPAAHVSKEDLARIRGQAKHSDDTCSVASDASQTYSYVRLSLFPLYVSDVKSSWPESGRFRKVVDIDEAIRMCESRPEFLKPLIELKERNLHLLPEDETKGPNRILDR